MKLLDTNALDYMAKHGLSLVEEFFITPDIQDEYEAWHDTQLPKAARNIFDSVFDRASYLGYYKQMLNKYGQRSFYNMSGFGDISILAVLMTENETAAEVLPGLAEEMVVVSGDGPLIRKIENEFISKPERTHLKVTIISPQAFFNSRTA